jgi:DNA-binding PadR family transcriptional regulator
MKEQATIGGFEQLVLTAILDLGEQAYGVTIHGAVSELSSPKSVSLGAVYATLERLEDKRLITSRLSEPTPERGGRSKRYYRLERAGERALRESVATAKRVCDVAERIWGTRIPSPGRRLRPAGEH